jgi:hypothetical protein
MRYQIHVRSQNVKTGRSGFHGPDTYVAVTEAPDGVEVPYALSVPALEKRGIKLYRFGQGYKKHTGPRSAFGKAMAAALEFVEARQAELGQ